MSSCIGDELVRLLQGGSKLLVPETVCTAHQWYRDSHVCLYTCTSSNPGSWSTNK